MPTRTVIDVGGRIVELTNLDKVLWPDAGYTKADLIEYYATVASVLLPHLRGRPLSLTRHPAGIDGPSFYQKNAPDYAPEWLRTWPGSASFSNGSPNAGGAPEAGKAHRIGDAQGAYKPPGIGDAQGAGKSSWAGETPEAATESAPINYILADDVATLTWLANQNCIGIHPWLSTVDHPDTPNQIVIDLDPNPPTGFDEARRVAFVVREALMRMGLRGYPKVSGATGIHIYIPVVPQYPFSVTSRFAGLVGRIIADLLPEQATTERVIRRRGPRVYIDHLQNLPGQTIAAPYSVRPLPGAPISTPLTWDELQMCRPQDFTMKTVLERIRRLGDVFAPVLSEFQRLDTWIDELR